MPGFTYDTNVFIDDKPTNYPKGFVMSAVVIQELAAGARDKAYLRELEATRQTFENNEKLLIPNGEDWYLAGKILNSLYRASGATNRGARTRIPKEEQQRIVRDVLIARSAKRMNVTVVTRNLRDFDLIRQYCAVKTEHPDDFLP